MSQQQSNDDLPPTESSFISHLLELRDRLLRMVIAVTLIFAALFPFANDLYTILATPLLAHLPSGASMIAIEVISPFLTPLKMAFFAAIFLAMPYLLYQFWAFVAPGLYRHEKRLAIPLLVSSVILFYAGVAFAYFVVFPLAFAFLTSVIPQGTEMMTDINKYLDFILAMFFAFGLAFEVPIATIILIATGATSADALVQKRPYIIVGAFVIGMLLTPPDVISQVMLALPMWILFELGIIMSRLLIRPDQDATPQNTGEDNTDVSATTPQSHSTPAYPEDYTPLTEGELESELAAASAWDEEDDDDKNKT